MLSTEATGSYKARPLSGSSVNTEYQKEGIWLADRSLLLAAVNHKLAFWRKVHRIPTVSSSTHSYKSLLDPRSPPTGQAPRKSWLTGLALYNRDVGDTAF